jgi:hypothetical protein
MQDVTSVRDGRPRWKCNVEKVAGDRYVFVNLFKNARNIVLQEESWITLIMQ